MKTRVLPMLTFALFLSSTFATAQQDPERLEQQNAIKVETHLVVVDVVATDKHGPVRDLKREEFQLLEKGGGDFGDNILTSWMVPKFEQKISHFDFRSFGQPGTEYVGTAALMPAGIYSNISPTPITSPPTVLLLDALNTEPSNQSDARRQMILAIKQLPPRTPIAVYFLTRQLRMLQDFTANTELLREAVDLAISAETMVDLNPLDDPMSTTRIMEQMDPDQGQKTDPSGMWAIPNTGKSAGAKADGASGAAEALKQMSAMMMRHLEHEQYASRIDVRVETTLAALQAIAQHLAGYPGRKNLIWVSGSFPIFIKSDQPGTAYEFDGERQYQPQVQKTSAALTNAQVSVYPVDARGLEAPHMFDAANGKAFPGELERENTDRFATQGTMREIADLTGGRPCLNNNDLGVCVKRAIDDGSSYYEVSYYPSGLKWDGEYRQIFLKCTRPGVKLQYRKGYYAGESNQVKQVGYIRTAGRKKKALTGPLVEAVLNNPLTATGIPMVVQPFAQELPDRLDYNILLDPAALTFKQGENKLRELNLEFAWATFSRHGNVMDFYQYTSVQNLTETQYRAALAHGVGNPSMSVPYYRGTVRIRLAVRDANSGAIGTIDLPLAPTRPNREGKP